MTVGQLSSASDEDLVRVTVKAVDNANQRAKKKLEEAA